MGELVGRRDGALVILILPYLDGLHEGCLDGLRVGNLVGYREGSRLGCLVGFLVG